MEAFHQSYTILQDLTAFVYALCNMKYYSTNVGGEEQPDDYPVWLLPGALLLLHYSGFLWCFAHACRKDILGNFEP